MNIMDIIYSHTDPCVDIYYSAYYKELILGARRLPVDGQLFIDYLTHRLAAWPSYDEFGTVLLDELEKAEQRYIGPDNSGPMYERNKRLSISSAKSPTDFEKSFWPFVIWTKSNPIIPIIIGTPIAAYYSDSFNRRAVEKSKSAAELGAAVRNLIEEVTLELGKARLQRWGHT